MSKLVQLPPEVDILRLSHGFFDDFDWFITAHRWTTVASDSGTIVHNDATGGRVQLNPSDGTVANNDEAYLKSTTEAFKFASGKPLSFGARVQFTEGATDDVNILVGLKDAVAADSLLDDGAGPAASYSGALFYKADGGTKWIFETSNGGTQTTTTTDVTAGGSAFQLLEIEVQDYDATQCRVVPKIDGVHCRDASGNPIVHYIAYASLTDMQVGFGIKNGADTTVEALVVDYCYCYQKR